MVFLQAAARRFGPSAALIAAMERGEIRVYISAEVVTEVSRVLARPEIRRKNERLTPRFVEAFMERT